MGDEDCLTLNIQRPLKGDRNFGFIWIYGGGFNTGYSSDEMYRGRLSCVTELSLRLLITGQISWVLRFYDFTGLRRF